MMYCKSRDTLTTHWGSAGASPTAYASSIGGSARWYVRDNCWDVQLYLDWMQDFYDDGETKATPLSWENFPLQGSETFCSTKRGYNRSNDCHHMRRNSVNYPFGAVWFQYVGSYSYTAQAYTRRPIPLLGFGDDIQSHPVLDLRAARTTAWHTMQPEFEGQVELLNFIFELKDFKDMAKFVRNKPLSAIAKSFTKLQKKRGRGGKTPGQAVDAALNAAAEARLVNEFAIKPFISDLISIHLQLKEMVEDLQEQFNCAGLTSNTRHYSEDFVNSEDLSPVYNSPTYTGSMSTTRFTANMRYTYSYENRTYLDAFKKFWGLNLTAEVFWNAIPGSFLVDYFANIGKTLHIMEHDPNVDLTYSEYTESLLTTNSRGLYLNPRDDLRLLYVPVLDGNHCRSISLISGTQETLYSRKSTWPNFGPVAPRFRLPNRGQNLNMAALLKTLF